MKIACVIHSLSGGGAERVLAGLASRLAARGHHVTLITLGDGSDDRYPLADGVHRHPLGVMQPSRNIVDGLANALHRVRALRQALNQIGPDVVLSFCDQTNILTLLAARRLKLPVVVSERSDPAQQRLSTCWELQRRRTYRRAAAVVALTPPAARHLADLLHRDEVLVIPSAIDKPPFASERQAAEANRRIVAVGRLEHEKGFDRLLQAIANLIRHRPELCHGWTLRILGEGSQRGRLEQQIEQLQLRQQVSLPGWIRPLWDELGAATLFVLPSRYEGFPSALGEAMALGIPSVAVDCESGPRSMIRNGVNGLLVRNDLDGLEAGIRRLLADTAMRQRLGEAGKQIVDQFGWDAMVDAYEALLQRSSKPR
jgi:glycosyltransferase involved in cell wall biosynthesis